MSYEYYSWEQKKTLFGSLRQVKCTYKNCDCVTTCQPFCDFHMQQVLQLRVDDSLIPNAGKGVFATESIFKHQPITKYMGDILSKEELDAKYGADDIYLAPYAFELNEEWYVDPIENRFVAGYINAGLCPQHNNVMFEVVKHWNPRESQVWIMAKRDIQQGEELLIDYGLNYFC